MLLKKFITVKVDMGFGCVVMYGYAGKTVRIDLTNKKIKIKALEKGLAENYVGGKGFGAKILFEEAKPKTDPFDSSNLLIFATGPVNGTILPGAAKLCAVFKSPLTGIWGESQCGGYFAPQLKYAGYDILTIQGKSEKPVYLTIEDEKIEIRDAAHLWGKDTFETESIIKKDHGERFQVLSIGQAGENMVRYACVSHAKGRQFGRCGAGAVMGSKGLKAVAVLGSGSIEISKPKEFEDFRRKLNEKIRERLKSLIEYGTPAIMALTQTTGSLPTRNWTQGEFEGFEEINAEAVKKKIMKRSKACYACTVACGKISRVETGAYAGTEVEGPEYETLFALGSLCGNSNLDSIAKLNEICDRFGMDTISAGNVLAFAMECYEKGLITQEDTDGLALTFGNHEAMITALTRIAFREGFGKVLAEGVRRASQVIGKGSEKFAVHVKGLEPPGYDPRGLKGVALAYAISCRGACHLRHMAYRPNLTGSHPFKQGKINRLAYNGQAEIVKELEDFHAIVDSMVLCKFICLPTIGPILWEELAKLYYVITGIEVKREDLIATAERINNLVWSINTREGASRKDDTLPERFMNEGLKKGTSKGEVVKKKEFEKMLDEYYKIRGEPGMEGFQRL
jgi:aldehyde:ferredoxin oxidoreductase